MPEAASDGGSKYHVFYYDVRRNVELAARVPSEDQKKDESDRHITLQVRAKLIDGEGQPCIAHYNVVKRKNKTYSFTLSNPTRWMENTEYYKRKTGETIIVPKPVDIDAMDDEERKKKLRSGDLFTEPYLPPLRLPNLRGAHVTCRLANRQQQSEIKTIFKEIQSLQPKPRREIIDRTAELIEFQARRKARERKRLKDTHATELTAHEIQQRIEDAGADHIPRVHIMTKSGSLEKVFFEEYKARFYQIGLRAPRKRISDIDAKDAAQQMHDAMRQYDKSGRLKRDPSSLDEDDIGVPMSRRARKPKEDHSLTCEDPLYRLEDPKDENSKVEAPHIKIALDDKRMNDNADANERKRIRDTFNGKFEAWILLQEPTPTTPCFFVIKRSKKNNIEYAARFTFSRDEGETANLCAELAPYNLNNEKPITHPAHTMFRHGDNSDLEQAQEIANIIANDALACWHDAYGNISRTDNMHYPRPDNTLSKFEYKGRGFELASQRAA